MKALTKEIPAALGFIAIGMAVALGVVLVHDVEASPDPDVSYVIRGMSPLAGQQCSPYKDDPDYGDYWIDGWHTCWHLTEPGYPAIDYTRTDGQTAGSTVYLDYEGDFQLFKMLAYGGTCKGVRAGIYWGSYDDWNYKGDVHYLHIDVNAWVIGDEVPWQLYWIGYVAEEENLGCDWTGAHLHQSADWSASAPFYSNKFRDPSQGANWEHAILWEPGTADSDYDGFTNQNELYIDTDPFDDCADAYGDDAWPPDFNDDTLVDVTDAMMFLAHFPSGLPSPGFDPRYDMQPNGAIDVIDALIFLAYFPSTCA